MIKKFNIALIAAIVVLFGLKLLLDLLDSGKVQETSVTACEASAATELAPTIYYYQWRPYVCVDPISNRNGRFLDVVRAVFPKAKFVRKGTNAAEFAKLLDADPVSACVIYGDHPDIERHPAAKTPVGSHGIVLYVPRSLKWRYTGPDSLDQIIIGVETDYCDSKRIRALREKWKDDPKHIRLITADDSLEVACQLAEEHKIDAYAASDDNPNNVQAHTSRRLLTDFRCTPQIDRVEVLFRVSGTDPAKASALIDAWEKGMKAIRESGELARINEYYDAK